MMGGGQQVHVATVESEVEGYKNISEAATLPIDQKEKKGKSKEKKPKEKKSKSVTVVETAVTVGPAAPGNPPEEFPLPPPPEDTLLNLVVLNRYTHRILLLPLFSSPH